MKRAAYHAQIVREASSATKRRLWCLFVAEKLWTGAEALVWRDAVVHALGVHDVA